MRPAGAGLAKEASRHASSSSPPRLPPRRRLLLASSPPSPAPNMQTYQLWVDGRETPGAGDVMAVCDPATGLAFAQ